MEKNLADEESNTSTIIFKVSDETSLNQSQSLKWRIFHGTHSMLGGLFLTSGSSMYFVEIVKRFPIALYAGGWLLTIGSFFLLLADLQEWWYHRITFNKKVFQHSRSSISDRLKKIENQSNLFIAACGSAFYVIGSFLLIPTFEEYVILGSWLVIIGSTIIFLSASWKISRTGHLNVSDPYDQRFRFAHILNDWSALSINVLVGFGGAFYFIGVLLSLPKFSVNDFRINLSSSLCVLGGSSFFLASIFLQYRYYCKQ